MRILFTALLLFTGTLLKAQNISGIVVDKDNKKPIAGATINLLLQSDSSVVLSTAAGRDGGFSLTGAPKTRLIITITAIGFQQYVKFIQLTDVGYNLETIELYQQKEKELTGVTLVAKAPAVVQKGDTAEYNASQFKVNPDANAEDLVKKMPGITVDKSGTVTAQGEQVKTVTVDGKRFFGDDATAALRNLPAEIIDKIQVFDRLSDQAQFTGFDDGSGQKSMNIITKSGMRNGQFGRLYGGYGTDNRYNAGGNVSFFKGDRRVSIVGLFNNINQQNFSGEDLLGVSGSGSNRGGNRSGGMGMGMGGGGNWGGGNTQNFFVGQQSGINETNSLGINYSDKWFKKLDVNGSYFFNVSHTNNDQTTAAQYFFLNDTTQLYDENSLSRTKNFNNRINLRFEYNIDSSNSLIFTPVISFQKNNAFDFVAGNRYLPVTKRNISITDYNRDAASFGYNSNNNLLYRHSFKKKGRTISLNIGYAFNNKNADTYLESVNSIFTPMGVRADSLQQYTDLNVTGKTYSANITYTEPIGKKAQLMLSYAPSVTENKSDQDVYQFDNSVNKYSLQDTGLSNVFNNTITTQNANISYRRGDRDNMLMFGLGYRNTKLESNQLFPITADVNKSFNNLLPTFIFRKKFNTQNSLAVFYRSNTNVPSVSQLQNVVNNNNPLFLSTGNPGLKQSFNNTLSVRYTFTNTKKSKSLFANIFLQQTGNYIANATYLAARDSLLENKVVLARGAQLTKPINLNGFYSLRSFLTYGTPLKVLKSNLNINGGFTLSNIPGLVNNANSTTKSYTYSGGAVLASNISERIDFNISYNASYNVAINSLQASLNNKYLSQQMSAVINLLSKKGWFIQNDISNQSYSGLSEGFNQRYWIWNIATGKKFGKKKQTEVRLSVFDLLKQNQSITRNVSESNIQDVQNVVLTRYVMLTFTYKLKNFGTPKQNNNRGYEYYRNMPGGMQHSSGMGAPPAF